MLILADDWKDYEIIDAGNGEKLERWKNIVLRRPDPQAVWPADTDNVKWKDVHGHYHRSSKGGGTWEFKKKIPERWTISYKGLSFYIKPTGFKHTGLFPEQAANWSWMMDKILKAKRVDKPFIPSSTPAASLYSCSDFALGSVSFKFSPS